MPLRRKDLRIGIFLSEKEVGQYGRAYHGIGHTPFIEPCHHVYALETFRIFSRHRHTVKRHYVLRAPAVRDVFSPKQLVGAAFESGKVPFVVDSARAVIAAA